MIFPKVESKDKEFYVYRWDVKFYNDIAEGQEVYPDKILKMTKISLYKDKVMPVMLAEMRFTKADVARLKSMVKHCLCTVTCMGIVYTPTSGGNELEVGSGQNAYIQTDSNIEFSATFEPIFDINTFKASKYDDEQSIEKEEEAKNGELKDGILDSPTQVVHMSLVNANAQRVMKTLYNAILSDDDGLDVGTVLNWICSESDVDGYIIDKPASHFTVNEVIIPTLTLIPAIKYIQTMYGVYENGIQPFIDYDNILYILDKYADEHDHEKGDTSLIHIYVVDVDKYEATSMTRSKNLIGEAMYIGSPYISDENDEVLKGEIIGNNFAFSSFNQTIDAISFNSDNEPDPSSAKDVAMVLKRNLETHSATGEKTICDYDEMNNVYNMSSRFNELEAQARKLTVTLQNAKIEDFKVNKFVELHFQNSSKQFELGGVYYLNAVQLDFNYLPSGEMNKLPDEVSDVNIKSKTNGSCTLKLSRRNDL